MMRTLTFFISLFILFGCAGTQVAPQAQEESAPMAGEDAIVSAVERNQALQNINEDQLDAYEVKTGIIVAQTDFKGVMEKTYVKLFLQNIENAEAKFDLYIGDKAEQQAFPWDAKTVQPGYFFIELPAGKYKISTISIPVGSTQATESIDIDLEVFADEVTYLGTLQVTGTKERIKLGGVPVIRPGFEYTATVLNEEEEAVQDFKSRFPNFSKKINVQLMQLNNATNKEQ